MFYQVYPGNRTGFRINIDVPMAQAYRIGKDTHRIIGESNCIKRLVIESCFFEIFGKVSFRDNWCKKRLKEGLQVLFGDPYRIRFFCGDSHLKRVDRQGIQYKYLPPEK